MRDIRTYNPGDKLYLISRTKTRFVITVKIYQIREMTYDKTGCVVGVTITNGHVFAPLTLKHLGFQDYDKFIINFNEIYHNIIKERLSYIKSSPSHTIKDVLSFIDFTKRMKRIIMTDEPFVYFFDINKCIVY